MYAHILKAVERFCMGALNTSSADAQDLAAVAVATVWEHYGDKAPEEQQRLAFAIAKRRTIDLWRRGKRLEMVTMAEPWQEARDALDPSTPDSILEAACAATLAKAALDPHIWEHITGGVGELDGRDRTQLLRMRAAWREGGEKGLALWGERRRAH